MTNYRSGIVVLALVLAGSGCALQKPAPPPMTPISVAAAKELVDETPVMLEGYVIEPLGNESYIFQDETGQITVEIDDDEWLAVRVGPRTKVRVIGTMDGDYGGADLAVEVEQIKVLQEEPFPRE